MRSKYLLILLIQATVSICSYAQSAKEKEHPLLLLADDRSETYTSFVTVPHLPSSMDFAGEKVPMANFDTQESLIRELSVTSNMHSRTLLTLLSKNRYFSIIEPILELHGIPSDFKYLCMAESGLNPNVVSTAGAAGLWQIMAPLAKSNGMEVNGQIDERYNIEKATVAACKYIKEAYRKFGSWSLAAASYNIGMAGLSRRMETQGVKNYYDLYLPEETMRYLFRILSFKLVTENSMKYGFVITPEEYYKPFKEYRQAEVSEKNIDWSNQAAKYGTTYKLLRELNPWIREYSCDNKDSKTYNIKVPKKGFRD